MSTGFGYFVDGRLAYLETVKPWDLRKCMEDYQSPDLIVMEDSRLQSHVWSRGLNHASAIKVARNIGQIDAWCEMFAALAGDLKIPYRSISPEGKGSKIDAETFNRITGWSGPSNQHTRDAAMVAWPYRSAR